MTTGFLDFLMIGRSAIIVFSPGGFEIMTMHFVSLSSSRRRSA